MQRQRVCADYLQTSAVIGEDWGVRSAVNDPNEYSGPGTGYVLDAERWQLLQALPQTLDPRDFDEDDDAEQAVEELHVAKIENDPDEVVIAVGPAFGDVIRRDDQRAGACATSSPRSRRASVRREAGRGSSA